MEPLVTGKQTRTPIVTREIHNEKLHTYHIQTDDGKRREGDLKIQHRGRNIKLSIITGISQKFTSNFHKRTQPTPGKQHRLPGLSRYSPKIPKWKYQTSSSRTSITTTPKGEHYRNTEEQKKEENQRTRSTRILISVLIDVCIFTRIRSRVYVKTL